MSDKRADFPCPQVMRPFQSYRSPVTDEAIGSRKEREQDLVRHDCMPYQDIKRKPPKEIDHAG